MAFFYFYVIDPLPTPELGIRPLNPVAFFIFVSIFVFFMIIGISWGNKHKRNIKKWYSLIDKGEMTPADIPLEVKQEVINFPLYATGIASLMWTLSSLMAGYVTWSFHVFTGLLGSGGVVAVILLYFVDDLMWRPILPVFFPEGNLSEAHAFHLPIFWKLLIIFLFTGILPPVLLVNLTWQRITTLLAAPNPEKVLENLWALQLFILGASIIVSVGLAFFITRSITNPIQALRNAMKRVQDDDLDVKITIMTHDELGYLGERFNEMTAELRQKEALRNSNTQLREQLEKIRSLEAALREQAVRDPLTGLFNRRYMLEMLEQEILKANRHNKRLSVVMLDLDNLKKINDKYGHIEGGDQSLKYFSNVLQSLCRGEDTVCRYAGDEFVVIISDTSAKTAYERALSWKEIITKAMLQTTENIWGVTFSAGVAEYGRQKVSAEELLRRADRALYQAKEAGRNRVVIYEDTE